MMTKVPYFNKAHTFKPEPRSFPKPNMDTYNLTMTILHHKSNPFCHACVFNLKDLFIELSYHDSVSGHNRKVCPYTKSGIYVLHQQHTWLVVSYVT